MSPVPTARRVGSACLVLFALGVIGVVGLIAFRNYRAAHSMLEADPPSPLLAAPQRTGIARLTSVSFPSRQGGLRLAGWYIPPTDGAAVVVAHGTNSDRSSMLPELRVLSAAGYGVLALEWPGLGGSEGSIRWDGQAREALAAAIDWLARQPGVSPERIGGLGFSIGGYVMAQVAATDERLRAVILAAPPPDFEDYVQVHYSRWGMVGRGPARLAIRDSGVFDTSVDPLRLVARIAPRPVLLLGGTLDQEIPAALVRKLYAAAHDPKSLWIVNGANHGDYAAVAGEAYAHRLTDFFARALTSH